MEEIYYFTYHIFFSKFLWICIKKNCVNTKFPVFSLFLLSYRSSPVSLISVTFQVKLLSMLAHSIWNSIQKFQALQSHWVAWPSGLRRWFKAPVSSEAWVRIPPLPWKQFFSKKKLHSAKITSTHSWLISETVRIGGFYILQLYQKCTQLCSVYLYHLPQDIWLEICFLNLRASYIVNPFKVFIPNGILVF